MKMFRGRRISVGTLLGKLHSFLSWKKSGSIHWPLGYCVFVNFLSNHGSLDYWHQQQTGWRQEAPGGKESYLLGVPSLKASFAPSAPARYPLQSRVTAHLQDGAPAHVSSQFFSATLTWLLSRLSLFFILGIKEIQIAMHLSAVVPSSQPMDRSMWYHVRPGALMPCLGSDFLQFTRVHTTQISDNIKVYLLPWKLSQAFIDVCSIRLP